MARRANDFYPTPAWLTKELLRRVPIMGFVVEPCAGDGDIARVLEAHAMVLGLKTNDIDPKHYAGSCVDARHIGYGGATWVVSNPPFSCALEIVANAVRQADCAFLLRLSFMEPTLKRGPWLRANPPTQILVAPRTSFTGDRKTDSVTCAWFVWQRGVKEQTVDFIERPVTA